MKTRGFLDLDFAKLDIHRIKRRGIPEIIYSPNKTDHQLKKIIQRFIAHSPQVFISRLPDKRYKVLKRRLAGLRYFKAARLAFLGREAKPRRGNVLILSAGTSDIAVAEEAAVFLELLGNKVERVYDVGAAGLHRLDPFLDKIKVARVIVVVAGMEAALLTIVTGLSPVPVIGLPTSVGYGAAFDGLAALLGMLNACPLGSAVVNIDNGIGAGYMAHLINNA
jgi:hypothetical protein